MEDEISELGFEPQKRVIYNKLLPYSDEINAEIREQISDIKENLAKAVILRDIRPGCIHWVSKLSRFVRMYGVCFSKEDHVILVKMIYQLAVIPNQEFWVMAKFAQMLTILLKKKELLSPDDLMLEWRPLYELYNYLFYNSYNTIGMLLLPSNAESVVENMIRVCRIYFPITATSEILAEVEPLMCPFDMTMQRAMQYLELFLPTTLKAEDEGSGWKLWHEKLLGIWGACHNSSMWFWENSLFWLFSRLAWSNIGYVDWEQNLPTIFTKVLRSFRLPVSYKKAHVGKTDSLSQFATAMFIVSNLGGGSKTQEHLERLFKSLESYYHPSNSGMWTRHLHEFLNKITLLFVRRLHRERYKKPSWELEVPSHKKLTEDEITAFVKCIQTPAMLTMFSHTGTQDAGIVFHRLSLLRPEIIVPPVLEQLYSSLETTTEPHRLTASLECIVCVARALVKGGKHYPEGQTHVIPLLLQTLPGIDPNDIKKCMVTFQFIYTLVTLVPFVDCSSAIEEYSDLTELEQEVCMQTAGFEDFVLQFMDRCFALIENSTLEQITQLDRETEKMNREENMLEMGLSSTFSAILTQSHPTIYEAALRRLQTFIKGKMIEIHVAGKFAANMCRSAVKVKPEQALKVFVPGVCRLLMALTDNEEIQNEEHLDDELLFNLLLLSELVRCSGRYLVPYVPQISQVLTRTLHLKSREGYHLAGCIIRYLLKYLGITMPSEYRSLPHDWDTPLSVSLPIRHWGEAGDVHNLSLSWVEPGAAEEEAMNSIVRTFLLPELKLLREVARGEKEVTRETLQQSLSIALDIVLGAGNALPHWDEETVPLIEMSVRRDSSKFIVRKRKVEITLDSDEFPSNVRQASATVILELVDKLLEIGSDDTKSLCRAINIYHSILFFHGVLKEDFDARWKSFQFIKDALANKLTGNKQHIRSLLIERAVLQQESRVLENSVINFTETHTRVMTSLFKLSISHYSEVRSKGQSTLAQVFQCFPYSYKLILPDLITCLKLDPTEKHEEFKGSLYVLLGRAGKSLMVRRDWESLNKIWPALLSAQHSEKPSIIRLMNALFDAVFYHMELFAIYPQISESACVTAEELLNSGEPRVKEGNVDTEAVILACENLAATGTQNHKLYQSLVTSLAQKLESNTLHWRMHSTALSLLGHLIRPDVGFPACGVRALTSNLIHDNIRIREISVFYMSWILKNQKRKHKKIEIDPCAIGGVVSLPSVPCPSDSRPDNRWLQYSSENKIKNEVEWENRRFVDKTYIGWYTWPKNMTVYAPSSQQPSLERTQEQLSDEEREVYKFFINQDNVDKLVSFLSLEENKDKDGFNTRRFWMFKGLFRNFGDTFLKSLLGHLEKLVNDTKKSSQRCATEIIAGVIRGSKHWGYKKWQNMWSSLVPVLSVGMAKVTVETVEDWGTCMATASADRDPNRLAPLLELLLEDPLRAGEGAFNNSSRMYMLMGGLWQQEWRVSELSHKLLEYLRPSLAHPYKSIRDRIGSVLSGIFMYDLVVPGGSETLYPHSVEFIDYILPQLAPLIQESGLTLEDSDGAKYSPPNQDQDRGSPVNSDSLSSVGVFQPMGDIGTPAAFSEASLASMLSAVNNNSQYSPLVNLIEGPSPLSGRETKEALRLSAKINLKDNTNMSTREICEPMDVDQGFGKSANGFVGNEEKKRTVRLMNTVCRWLVGQTSRCYNGVTPEIYKFLPFLCQMESVDYDPELRSNCVASLAVISQALVLPSRIPALLDAITQVAHSSWWRARGAVLSVLQVAVFTNMFTVLDSPDAPQRVQSLVVSLLKDTRLEVQQMASTVLSGLIHCKFIQAEDKLLGEFTAKLQTPKGRKRTKSKVVSPPDVLERHAAVLGLCAYVSAFPYEVPDMLPQVLVTLSEHLNDPHPIPATIKKTLSNFRRTHHDNWRDHKQKFTDDELVVLTDLLLSPSYYA